MPYFYINKSRSKRWNETYKSVSIKTQIIKSGSDSIFEFID